MFIIVVVDIPANGNASRKLETEAPNWAVSYSAAQRSVITLIREA
jgi:hypothetical protein